MDNIIKRKRKKRQKRNYFNQETDDAIILYNKTKKSKLKSKIYEDGIHYSFFKLTQNIIHTFKFYNTDVENLEHLQHEIIVFLLSKIHLFNYKKNIQDRIEKIIIKEFKEEYTEDFPKYIGRRDKPTQQEVKDFIATLDITDKCSERLNKSVTVPKGYSYFGTIVKRWLINYTTKNYKIKINNISIDNLNTHSNKEQNSNNTNISIMDRGVKEITRNEETFEINDLNEIDNDDPLSFFIEDYIKYIDANLFNLFPKKIDSKIADAVLDLFKKRKHIHKDLFNKKALYLNIREKVKAKTPKITKIVKKMHDVFKERHLIFINEGHLPYL